MPTIKDSTGQDLLSGYSPVAPTATPAPASAPSVQDAPGKNPFLRCSLPPIFASNPDSLRQWFNGGAVPQHRILVPLPNTNSGNVTVNESAYIAGGGSGGGGSSTNVTIDANTTFNSTGPVLFTTGAVITTPVLPPGGKYIGSTLIANTFQLCSITASSPCRVQLYGSALAQQADLARGLDDPCPAGVFQNLVTDIALDTIPYQWNFQDRCASNNEDPQTNVCYVTITNLDKSSDVIFVNIQYVALSLGNNPGAPVISLGSLLGNTPISNTLLSTWGNVAQLTGAIFSGPVSTNTLVATTINATTVNSVDINASGSIVATVIQGDIDAVSITASGSIVGTDIEATGSISTVDITCSGSSVSNTFSGDNITVTEVATSIINGTDQTGIGANANNTLSKVITQSAVSGTTFTFTLAELTTTGVSFTVTSAGTSDVFNLNGEMLYKVASGTNGAFLVALVGGVIGSAFGFGIDNIPSTSGPSTCVFTGSTTGLSAGTHNITLYFASMVLVSGSPTIQVAGGVTNIRTQGQLQQISE